MPTIKIVKLENPISWSGKDEWAIFYDLNLRTIRAEPQLLFHGFESFKDAKAFLQEEIDSNRELPTPTESHKGQLMAEDIATCNLCRLRYSAPELLAALKNYISGDHAPECKLKGVPIDECPCSNRFDEQAKAAIAKAEPQ